MSHCLIFTWASSAISGVAVFPVPIAQIGSYAITTESQFLIESLTAFNYALTTALVSPASLCSNDSPIHTIAFNPSS